MSENAVLAAQRRMGYTKEEMTGQGLRSMDSTLLHELGWNHQVIERQLAHAERNAVSAACAPPGPARGGPNEQHQCQRAARREGP